MAYGFLPMTATLKIVEGSITGTTAAPNWVLHTPTGVEIQDFTVMGFHLRQPANQTCKTDGLSDTTVVQQGAANPDLTLTGQLSLKPFVGCGPITPTLNGGIAAFAPITKAVPLKVQLTP